MLQQMLAEDKADMVREAVIKSLGIIMGYIDDPDKYSQVCVPRRELLFLKLVLVSASQISLEWLYNKSKVAPDDDAFWNYIAVDFSCLPFRVSS